VGALLAYLADLAVNNRVHLYPMFFSFLLHTMPEDVLKMIVSPHTQLELITQNPHMPVHSLEEQALHAIFRPMYANVFGNMWHSSIGRPDRTNTESLKNITGHLYIIKGILLFFL
jgi:hypothetical protein